MKKRKSVSSFVSVFLVVFLLLSSLSVVYAEESAIPLNEQTDEDAQLSNEVIPPSEEVLPSDLESVEEEDVLPSDLEPVEEDVLPSDLEPVEEEEVLDGSPSWRTVKIIVRNRDDENITDQCSIIITHNGTFVTPESANSFELLSYETYRVSIRADGYKPLNYEWYLTNVYSKEFTLQTEYINISGANRYQTAVDICKQSFPDGVSSGNLVLVYGEDFPDALAANSLAGCLQAPILLTGRNSLRKETADYLRSDEGRTINKVIFVGGAFSDQVVNDLVALGIPRNNIDTTSCAGINRYETAEKVCLYQLNELGKGRNMIVVATGQNPADSLSISTFSYRNRIPILLAQNGELSETATNLAKRYRLIIYLGGAPVVHDIEGVADYPGSYDALYISSSLGYGKTSIRLGGANRYETSIKIAEFYQSYHPDRTYDTIFVSGRNANYPDALVAGMMANAYERDKEPPVILCDFEQNTVTGRYIDQRLNQEKSDGYDMYFIGIAAKGSSTIYDWVTMMIGAVG